MERSPGGCQAVEVLLLLLLRIMGSSSDPAPRHCRPLRRASVPGGDPATRTVASGRAPRQLHEQDPVVDDRSPTERSSQSRSHTLSDLTSTFSCHERVLRVVDPSVEGVGKSFPATRPRLPDTRRDLGRDVAVMMRSASNLETQTSRSTVPLCRRIAQALREITISVQPVDMAASAYLSRMVLRVAAGRAALYDQQRRRPRGPVVLHDAQ